VDTGPFLGRQSGFWRLVGLAAGIVSRVELGQQLVKLMPFVLAEGREEVVFGPTYRLQGF
jgi:hypothetical protein